MIPKAERQNILNLAHRTHLGEHMMQKQLRGRVFWCNMNRDIKTMVRDCDPCNRFHRSHPQEKVEVSHGSMFEIFAGHTVHMDFASYKNKDYCFIVDRLTGYLQADLTQNQGTECVILCLKRCSYKYGFPYKVIAEGMGFDKNLFHNFGT